MASLHNGGFGIRMRSDARGLMFRAMPPVPNPRHLVASSGSSASRMVRAVSSVKAFRFNQQKRSPWRHHQSRVCETRGRCAYSECPGFAQSKAKYPRAYDTNMRCEECSVRTGKPVFLCNGTKGRVEGEKMYGKYATVILSIISRSSIINNSIYACNIACNDSTHIYISYVHIKNTCTCNTSIHAHIY